MGGESENSILFITQSIGNCLSALASLSVIIIYLSAKPLQNYTFRLVYYLNLSNFIRAISMLIPKNISQLSPVLCKLDAYLFYSSSLSSLIWTLIIALNLYFIIIIKTIEVEKHFKYNFIASNIFPYILCFLPFILDIYKPTQTNCLLAIDRSGNIFRIVLYYGPATIVIFICLLIYLKLYFYIKTLCMNGMNHEARKLLYYPIILIVSVVPIFIYRALEFFRADPNLYFLVITNSIWTLSGLFDALAYALNKTVLSYIKKKYVLHEKTLNESEFIEVEATF